MSTSQGAESVHLVTSDSARTDSLMNGNVHDVVVSRLIAPEFHG